MPAPGTRSVWLRKRAARGRRRLQNCGRPSPSLSAMQVRNRFCRSLPCSVLLHFKVRKNKLSSAGLLSRSMPLSEGRCAALCSDRAGWQDSAAGPYECKTAASTGSGFPEPGPRAHRRRWIPGSSRFVRVCYLASIPCTICGSLGLPPAFGMDLISCCAVRMCHASTQSSRARCSCWISHTYLQQQCCKPSQHAVMTGE